MAVLESAAFWIILAAVSELIAISPLKDNSIIQIVLSTLNKVKGKGEEEKKDWATYHQMVDGCLDLALVAHMMKSIVQYKQKNSIQPYRTSWITLKTSGWRLSLKRNHKLQKQKQEHSVKTDGLYQKQIRHSPMIEPFVPLFIAVGTGFAVLTSRIYNKISHLDTRVDGIELRIVQDFVSKSDLQLALDRMESHMVRIEDKLDAIASNKCAWLHYILFKDS